MERGYNRGINDWLPFEVSKASMKRAVDNENLETMFEGMSL